MLFVNSFNDKMTLAYHLRNLFSVHLKNNGKKIIKTFILLLKPDTKEKYLEIFCNSDTKI